MNQQLTTPIMHFFASPLADFIITLRSFTFIATIHRNFVSAYPAPPAFATLPPPWPRRAATRLALFTSPRITFRALSPMLERSMMDISTY
jgi:hypothetical protein